ncbi:hypothetical protein ABTG89_16560 [Acinetobacter baumannii]
MKALFILIILAVVGSIGYSLYVQYRIDEISAGYTSHEKEVISKEIIQAQSLPNVASPSGTWDMTSATCGEQDFTNNIPSHNKVAPPIRQYWWIATNPQSYMKYSLLFA